MFRRFARRVPVAFDNSRSTFLASRMCASLQSVNTADSSGDASSPPPLDFLRSLVGHPLPVTATCGTKGYNMELLNAEAADRGLSVVGAYPPADKKGNSSLLMGASAHQRFPKRSLKLLLLQNAEGNHAGVLGDGTLVAFGHTAAQLQILQDSIAFSAVPRDSLLGPSGVTTLEKRYTVRDAVPMLGYELPDESEFYPSFVDDGPLNAIVLEHDTALEKIPFIFVLAEMAQLKALETLLSPLAGKVSQWHEHVKKTGSLPMNMTEARKLRARLLRLNSHLSKVGARRHRILWESESAHHRLIYRSAYDHFELSSHNEALRSQMETVGNSLSYLCEEAHAETNHHLEIVIILLIMVEVVIALLGKH